MNQIVHNILGLFAIALILLIAKSGIFTRNIRRF